jgi:hypothetical protein
MISSASVSGWALRVMPTLRHINDRRELRTSAVSSRLRSDGGIWYWIAGCWSEAASLASRVTTARPAILPKTRPSSRELLPSRLAPCRPVEATSPQAYRFSMLVRAEASVLTPPIM